MVGVDRESGLPVRAVDVLRVRNAVGEQVPDFAATEEPLAIRLQGAPFIVTMRTPGNDFDLVAGFLFAERLIQERGDLRTLRHCDDTADIGNVVDVMLNGPAADRAERRLAERRYVAATSACGVCGRQTIDDLLEATPRVADGPATSATVLASLPNALRRRQVGFGKSGGLHAAGLFRPGGSLMRCAEDVGRHNAVDKIIGAEVLAGNRDLGDTILFVSGRVSFEIVQKAVLAGIAIIAAVSAPSSLAIELAAEARATLIGFVRDGQFNVYAGRERVVLP